MSRKIRGPAEPQWIDLPDDIRLKVRLIDPAAEMAMQDELSKGHQAGRDQVETEAEMIITLAKRSIVAWEGFDEPCTPEMIEALMRNGYQSDNGVVGMAAAFNLAMGLARFRWRAEGEGSAVSPSSTGEAAQATAEAAETPVPLVPPPSPGDAPAT